MNNANTAGSEFTQGACAECGEAVTLRYGLCATCWSDHLDPTSMLDDDFRETLDREYSLSRADIGRVNAVIATWRNEKLVGSLADSTKALNQRVMEVL